MVRPIYLYIKKHNVTGLMYFGRTLNSVAENYNGSGTYWRNHLKKHGINISTIYFEKFENEEDAREFALFFSEEFDIVNSNKWANAIIEDASHTGTNKGIPMTGDQKKKLKFANIGKKHSEETKLKMSKAKLGKTRAKAKMIKYSCAFVKEKWLLLN